MKNQNITSTINENKSCGVGFIKYLAIFAFVFSAAMSGGCGKKTVPTPAGIPDDVNVATPVVSDVVAIGSYSARIAANEDVEVRARVGGYLESVKFKKGARVKKGDLLFKIDDRPYIAALDAARANVKALESKIVLAQSNADRADGLFKKNAISKEGHQTRQTELLVVKAKLLEAKAAEENARLNLEFTNVCAPVSGVVGENLVDVGNLVAAHATKLARIVDDSVVKVYFELNSADAVRYKNSGLLKAIDDANGAEVEVRMKSDSKLYKGKLCYYDNALATGTSSLILRADLDNRDGGLMVGAFGDITVNEGVVKNALLVPEIAIGTDLTGRYVLTLNTDNTVSQTSVKVGVMRKSLRVIEGGLKSDSRVVVEGIQRASVGRKVKPSEIKIGISENNK